MEKGRQLTTKEAIEKRRSIRKFKPETIPDKVISALLESARLAPSGCNAQPWRFKIVKDYAIKKQLQTIAYNQTFITEAPVVLVVCADIEGYIEGRTSGVQDLGEIGVFNDEICEILNRKTKIKSQMSIKNLSLSVAFNVAIAIEHIVLRAQDFGLGTCWMRLIDAKAIQQLFNWKEKIYPVALLPIGYPNESPPPRKRRTLEEIIID
ncbi:MAG: nitroreductase family protein [Saprospiraceae bacterium]|nr:nitroreductase family protein [Saprospiraceae bacterium]